MYRINEHKGVWVVGKDSPGMVLVGEPIDYETYKEFKDNPHKAKDHFKRDEKGKLTRIKTKETKLDKPTRLLGA